MLLGQNRSHNGTGTAGTQLAGNPVPPVTPASPGRTLNRRSERPGRSHVPHPCLPAKEPIQSSPGTPDSRAPVSFSPRAAAGKSLPAIPAAAVAAMALSRPIQNLRPRLDRHTPSSRTLRLRSNGRDAKIPLQPGSFSKETPSFPRFNPQSLLVEK